MYPSTPSELNGDSAASPLKHGIEKPKLQLRRSPFSRLFSSLDFSQCSVRTLHARGHHRYVANQHLIWVPASPGSRNALLKGQDLFSFIFSNVDKHRLFALPNDKNVLVTSWAHLFDYLQPQYILISSRNSAHFTNTNNAHHPAG